MAEPKAEGKAEGKRGPSMYEMVLAALKADEGKDLIFFLLYSKLAHQNPTQCVKDLRLMLTFIISLVIRRL